MASLFIAEFGGTQADALSPGMPVAVAPPIANQTVAIGAASAQSAAVNSETRLVRLLADATCAVAFGANPTATAAALRLTANVPEYFQLRAGQSTKVAVITAS